MLASTYETTRDQNPRKRQHQSRFSYATTAHISGLFCFALKFLDHTQLDTRYDSWTSHQPVVEASTYTGQKGKAIPLHAMEALGGRGGIAPTHSRPRH
jgi:hypothetical protein